MESNKNLVFLGMMGSGKTTLGKIISKRLDKKFIDIDQLIEIQEGMAISDINLLIVDFPDPIMPTKTRFFFIS